jgi:hypothetical protein
MKEINKERNNLLYMIQFAARASIAEALEEKMWVNACKINIKCQFT